VDVAGEELAVGGQGESSVWSGAQQGGADDRLKLADLAGEDGVPDADLAGCVVEAGLSGEGEEPSDALLGTRVGEGAPDVRGERAGTAEDGEGVGAAVDAVPDADAGLAATATRASTGVPVSAEMSLRLRWRSWYCSRSHCGSVPPSECGAGWRSLALVRRCLMVRSLHPVMRAILRAPYPRLVRSRSWSLPGGSGSGAGGARLPGASWGAGWRAAVSRT
jgi:hypothetical protein